MNPFNQEAGEAPAPSDPAELTLVRRAAAIVWRAVPYFALRYGERGRKFGLSDGGWLVTLTSLPLQARVAQVEWLASLLAARGMPTWLLEVQLSTTARVYERGRIPGAAALQEVVNHLSGERRRILTDAAFAQADRLFSEVAGGCRLATGTGRMIASAHVDVVRGICASVEPLVEWLRDPSRFRERWCAAVDRTSALVLGELRLT